MEVVFATKKLEKLYLHSREAERKLGQRVARRFISRVNIIKATRTFEELKSQRTLRCHPLSGRLQGKWSMTLVDRYRLTFELIDGAAIRIRILEVSNHYGD